MLPAHPHEESNVAKLKHHEALQHVIFSQWNFSTLCYYQYVVYTQLEWQRVSCWGSGRRGLLHSELGLVEESWDVAVVEDLWNIFAAQHTILGAHHALELFIYVEHKGCRMSLEFKFGTCVKTTWRTWYQIQMPKYYPMNRTLKHENFGAHSREQKLKT